MSPRTKRGVAATAVVLACTFSPRESAHAHCRLDYDVVGFYRAVFPHPDPNLVGPISVYLSDGALSSIEHTGLSAEQFLPILRATLSELNTHLDIATLQYAGVHSVDPVGMDGSLDLTVLPNGITVGSFECDGAYHPCAPLEAPGMAGCNKFPPGPTKPGTALVSLVPPECVSLASPSWSPAGGDSRDPVHALLHELGHALGLLHSSPALHCGDGIVNCNEECDDGNDVDGDGCTRCVLDAVPLDSGSGMGGGDSSGSRETGGSGGAGGSGGGCGCRTEPPVAAPLLVIPGALGAIRRRRRARR
jgi:cysteine-rich repeat protein